MSRKRGQASTEYMLVISVLVVAVVAGSFAFVPTFKSGVDELSNDVSRLLSDFGSEKGGFGIAANGAAGSGNVATDAQNGRTEEASATDTGDFDPAAGNGI